MVRAPCCEKMGLKKGPWAPEEDHVLINYIRNHGHSNWRALPKQAGLLRCGKSCRLRWTNYLRPDIKRGNFTREEEDSIIKLHEMLGNRWSAIAARLPGRTDNEIKNVWHTHLKKRLPQNRQKHDRKPNPKQMGESCKPYQDATKEQDPVSFSTHHVKAESSTDYRPLSPPQCSSDMSTLTTSSNTTNDMFNSNVETLTENIEALDEDFWSEVLSTDNSGETSEFPALGAAHQQLQFPFSPLGTAEQDHTTNTSSICDSISMDFWYDVYTKVEGLTELPQLWC